MKKLIFNLKLLIDHGQLLVTGYSIEYGNQGNLFSYAVASYVPFKK